MHRCLRPCLGSLRITPFTPRSAQVVFGGIDAGKEALDDLAVLQCDQEAWFAPQKAAVGPAARAFHAAAVVGSRMYLFGGHVYVKQQHKLHQVGPVGSCLHGLPVTGLSTPVPQGGAGDSVVGRLLGGRAGRTECCMADRSPLPDPCRRRGPCPAVQRPLVPRHGASRWRWGQAWQRLGGCNDGVSGVGRTACSLLAAVRTGPVPRCSQPAPLCCLQSTWEWSRLSGEAPDAPQPCPRDRAAMAPVGDGRLLVVGGADALNRRLDDAWLFDTEKWAGRRELAWLDSAATAAEQP